MPDPKVPQVPEAVTEQIDRARALLGERRTQVILGVGLVGLAVGIYIGVKVRGPKQWVGEGREKRCHECEEEARAAGMPPLTADDLARMARPFTPPVPRPAPTEAFNPAVADGDAPRVFSPASGVDLNGLDLTAGGPGDDGPAL